MILTSQGYGKIIHSFDDLLILSAHLRVCESTLRSLMWYIQI